MTEHIQGHDGAILRKLLLTVGLMFAARFLLTTGDPSYLCEGGTLREQIATIVIDVVVLVLVPYFVAIYRTAASARMRLVGVLVPLLALAVYLLLRNPCLLP
jgi:hypothetical protein